jgi:hypothetical protein
LAHITKLGTDRWSACLCALADHQASLGTAEAGKAGDATADSYMYLSCPLTTFPELAKDIHPFRFMVLPREWQPPSATTATNGRQEGDEDAEGDSSAIDSSRHDINLWMGTAGVTAQTHYDCSHNLYVQVIHTQTAPFDLTRTTLTHTPTHAGTWQQVVHSVAAVRAREAASVSRATSIETSISGRLPGSPRRGRQRLSQL